LRLGPEDDPGEGAREQARRRLARRERRHRRSCGTTPPGSDRVARAAAARSHSPRTTTRLSRPWLPHRSSAGALRPRRDLWPLSSAPTEALRLAEALGDERAAARARLATAELAGHPPTPLIQNSWLIDEVRAR
jgi:hypothetical protein